MNSIERIESLTVILTSQCNLRCSYCYQNSKESRSMDWKTLQASLDLILKSGHQNVGLGFMGGEPLLAFPMMRRGIEYAERARPPGMHVEYTVSTNGTLLTEEIATFLKKYDVKTQLSIDGVKGAQNLRGMGTFSHIDRLLDGLRKRHRGFYERNCTIAIVVTPDTVSHLADSIDYFLRKGARRISITPSIVSDPPWRIERIDELDAQFDRILKSSLLHMRRTGRIPVQILQGEPEDSAKTRVERPMCGLVHGKGIAVDVDGKAYGCNLFVDSYQEFHSRFMRSRIHGMRMGEIGDHAFARRYASFPATVRRAGMFHRKDTKYSSYGRCKKCRFLELCFVCPACIAHISGNSDPNRVSDFCCAFNMVALKYRESFPDWRSRRDILRAPAGAVTLMQRWRALAGATRDAGPA